MRTPSAFLFAALLLAGCWTFNETAYPDVRTTSAAVDAKTVHLVGFEALLTEWEAVHGYRTVFVPGHYGCRYYDPGYYTSVPAVDYIPQKRSTDLYLHRAQDLFEKAGFVLAPTDPTYTVDVRFEGPVTDASDDLRRFTWNVLTVFFCDWNATQWTASLRIRETKTGKLVFSQDYDQPYETGVVGLVPLFGTLSCDATDAGRMQGWCLSALTDRICADATAFIAGK